jgi:diaminohydroxyphosphoribosylaminopyrimidine deaminase/5-amino-6-(5-phosphoribosylamino)uracil reductase
MSQIEDDERLMAAVLSLSRRSLGLAAPNPSVGALVVKDGRILGSGVTGQGGRPHAETQALLEAGDAAKGATLYVSLEPCSHHGRTPPCTDAIVAAGIARVVSALEDPNPQVAGAGHKLLRAAGLEVVTGIRENEAFRLHLGHILAITAARPMLTVKLAETVDGFAAGRAGDSRLAITGALANAFVHMQRALHDAILIGIGTAIADDPLLTIRLLGLEARKPLRIVLDTKLRLSPESQLARTARDIPTLVIAGNAAQAEAVGALEAKHVEVVKLPVNETGHLDLKELLAHLGARGLTRILSEGGPCLAGALIDAGFADDVILLESQNPLGYDGLPALDERKRAKLSDEALYHCAETRHLGEDRLTRYERKL